jgi:prephenate dehydratase
LTARVAYLGPAGTFSGEALRASAAAVLPGEDVEELPQASVHEAVTAIAQGRADRAVVPIENVLEGGVAATLDALVLDAPELVIAAEVVLPVRHLLVAAEPLPLERVERVLSHPQATSQCGRFLRERLPGAEVVAAGSTAEAVRTVREAGRPWAALGSRLAVELYGGSVLAEGVEDHPGNRTRFVWLAAGGGSASVPGPRRTSIVFWGTGDESPGWLVRVLNELSGRGINMTRIESRPRRDALGHYMFFVDVDGEGGEAPVGEALTALRSRVETLRVLGSYPVIEPG